jgi:hypothetical protein
MSRAKKIRVLLPIVIVCFLFAYADHKYEQKHTAITGHLQGKQLDEISGIAASGINNNVYYIHNDSGDTSRFFAITPAGNVLSTIYFKGKSYVYLGDIGDNNSTRPYITVYRMEEQKNWSKDSITTTPAAPVHFKYPDGPKDAETLMIDPIEKLICIVSKRKDSVTVYTSPLNYKVNDTLLLTKRCKLYFKGFPPFKWITAGDISKDGQQVLLKNYVKVFYWKRIDNEPIWKTLQRKPEELPYEEEKQGEAIGFTPDGKGYYTTSEGIAAPIYYYSIPAQPAAH